MSNTDQTTSDIPEELGPRVRVAKPLALIAAVAVACLAGAWIGAAAASRKANTGTTVTVAQPATPSRVASTGSTADASSPPLIPPLDDPRWWFEHGPWSADLGVAKLVGKVLAGRAQQFVSLTRAEAQSDQVPVGAERDQRVNTLRFTTKNVEFSVVASPPNGRDMTFRIAGLTNPTIVVPGGAQVRVEFINGDSDTAHMWVLASGVGRDELASDPSLVALAPPLGDPTSDGQPVELLRFTAATPGSYEYFCAMPGHRRTMYGRFVVAPA